MFLSGIKQKEALWIHLKVNKGKIHCSSLPQFIVVEHLKVLFWRHAQTRNISLRVRFDLVIEFYGHFTYSAVHLNHLQHFTARTAHMSKCISIPRSFHLQKRQHHAEEAGLQAKQIKRGDLLCFHVVEEVSRVFFSAATRRATAVIWFIFFILIPAASTDIPSRFDTSCVLNFKGVQGTPGSIRLPIRSICFVYSCLTTTHWIIGWM